MREPNASRAPDPGPSARLDKLYLWYLADPAMPQWVGTLQLMAVNKGVSLTYAPEWLSQGFALSEDLPLVAMEHLPRAKNAAAGAVDDARPDRWGERVIQFIDRPARLSLMEYLYYAGDDRFGALGVSTSSTAYLPRRNGPLPQLPQVQALSQAVAKIQAKEPITAVERQLMAAGGSLGGAKPKALIDIDGEQWVIKFFNGEPVDVPLIEHASMTLARLAGIRTARTQVLALAGEHALAIQRFDRGYMDGAARRVHCISANTALQAIAVDGEAPDLGYPNLAQLLRRTGVSQTGENERDRQELFRRMVFNILIDNTDDHEKNHALQITEPSRHGSMRLAPAYDVLPTNAGLGQQEFTVGEAGRESTLTNALSQCAMFGLTPAAAASEVLQVIEVVNGWQAHFKRCGVTDADVASLAEHIDGDALLSQRRSFKVADWQTAGKKVRHHPFR